MKKKLISVLLSAAMATTMLAGCGSTAADTGAAPAETKATEEKLSLIHISEPTRP